MNDQPASPNVIPTAIVLARSIAPLLPGLSGWTASFRESFDDQGRRYAELTRMADGAQLGVSVGGYRHEDRATFRAHWPRYADGRGYEVRNAIAITCEATRPPKALAAEIQRRLLPDYDPAYREALDTVRQSDAAAGAAWGAAKRIGTAIGGSVREGGSRPNNHAAVVLYGGPERANRISVHPAYGEGAPTVRLELHDLDEALALKLLAMLWTD